MKLTNICIIEVPEREVRKQGIENLCEEVAKNFPNPAKGVYMQVRGIPNNPNPKRPTCGHIIIKTSKVKDKERMQKTQLVCTRAPVRLSADFSTEISQARKDWHKIVKV